MCGRCEQHGSDQILRQFRHIGVRVYGEYGDDRPQRLSLPQQT